MHCNFPNLGKIICRRIVIKKLNPNSLLAAEKHCKEFDEDSTEATHTKTIIMISVRIPGMDSPALNVAFDC